jgi:hypothetical protein
MFLLVAPAVVGGVLIVVSLVLFSAKEGQKAAATGLLVVGLLAAGAAGVLFLGKGSQQVATAVATEAPKTLQNMQQLGIGIIIFAQDHGNQLPADLGTTFPYVDGGDVYVVAESGTPAPTSAAEVNGGKTDLVYFGKGLQIETPGADRVLVAATTPDVFSKRGYACALYLDGHAECKDTVTPDVRSGWLRAGLSLP